MLKFWPARLQQWGGRSLSIVSPEHPDQVCLETYARLRCIILIITPSGAYSTDMRTLTAADLTASSHRVRVVQAAMSEVALDALFML